MDSGTANANGSTVDSKDPPPSSKETLLQNLTRTIAKFSDGNLLIRNQKEALASSSSSSSLAHGGGALKEESIIRKFSPPGMEDAFQRLYSILFPSLHHRNNSSSSSSNNNNNNNSSSSSIQFHIPSSSAAILMGPKGSGKSLLLERCLAACRHQQRMHSTVIFRQVNINGIVCRGQDVGTVVYEIVRQLNELAFFQSTSACTTASSFTSSLTTRTTPSSKTTKDTTTTTTTTTTATTVKTAAKEKQREREELEYRRHKRQKKDRHLLRLRKSSFTSNLALLESTLRVADADQVPILIVLDELDSFTEEGERQLLLYHFLDRVATPGSNLILIGITSSFSALALLEKRIRSRAEGTAKVIYLRPPETYHDLIAILQHKLADCVVGKDLLERIAFSSTSSSSSSSKDGSHRIAMALEREFRVGKDLRWFSRVISTALSLYRHDCSLLSPSPDDSTSSGVAFDTEQHLLPALVMMGASITDANVATKQPDLCLIHGQAVDPRIQALLDMSKPQVALLLSAKRILARESHQRQDTLAAPLTLERMFNEYQSFRRGASTSSSTPQGNIKVLKKAAFDLLDRGILVPSMDHSGGGPLHYSVAKLHMDLDPHSLLRLPLHVPFEIERELGKILEQNLLDCPTALGEWGKSIK